MNIKSKTFCPFPFMNLNNNTDGSMKICCAQNENLHLKKDDGSSFNVATDDINEVKCPICRATQFKWIFDELIQTFLHDIDGYEAETPLELIVRTNMYL